MLGVAVGNLDDAAPCSSRCRSPATPRPTPSTPRSTRSASDSATALTRAALLGRDQGLEVPLLPD